MTARNLITFVLVAWVSCMVGSCTFVQPSTQSQSETSALPVPTDALVEFPLAKGTTWVYSYEEYEPTTTDPTQITTATYIFTETVVDTQSLPPYFIAHVQHKERLVKADPDWVYTNSSRSNEWWYVVSRQQIYQSFQLPDLTNFQLDALLLAYDLPFVTGKSWCPSLYLKGEKIQDCIAAGKRTVASQESYETPAGNFTECYKITEDVNSGGVTRWFCKGIGIVAEKYDHAGTRFGFQQTLISYSKGSP